MFAKYGKEVIGVDINENIVRAINNKELYIDEPDLYDSYVEVLNTGKLKANNIPQKADAFIISVPTPYTEKKECDLRYVISATKSILPFLEKGNLVILESTVGPRTTVDVLSSIIESVGFEVGKDIYLAHCPERVLPGKIMYELINNNRIIGGINDISTKKAAELYSTFVKGELLLTDATTAEMSKLMENTFRDVNIALANELVKICEKLDIDPFRVIELANKHPRVNIHQPGPGVGGHCLAIDPYFIIEKVPEEAKLIALARKINNSMPDYVFNKIINIIGSIDNPKIAVFGITYKGNTNDIRESPAIEIIKKLSNSKFNVEIFDPHVDIKDICGYKLKNFDAVIEKADLLLILADHNEFKNMDLDYIYRKMRTKIIFDTKNVIKDKEKFDGILLKLGFNNFNKINAYEEIASTKENY
jgi:UDP-N-acetyl-D-mannosaminuronic acid dehydrogenase